MVSKRDFSFRCYISPVSWPDGTASRLGSLRNRTRLQVEGFSDEICAGKVLGVVKPGGDLQTVAGELTSLRVGPAAGASAAR